MGKMKDLFIQVMNEDWERISPQEQAFLKAEREHMEQALMQQILFEEQEAAKIQVIKEDTTEKAKTDAADRAKTDTLPF